jgi:hypothetical protein
VGIRSIGGEEFARNLGEVANADPDHIKSIELDKSVGAVITGHNVYLSYASLSLAARYLLEQETQFIATNGDKLAKSEGPGGNTVNLPAGGMSMAALQVGVHCNVLAVLYSLYCTHCTVLTVLYSLYYTHCSVLTVLYTAAVRHKPHPFNGRQTRAGLTRHYI